MFSYYLIKLKKHIINKPIYTDRELSVLKIKDADSVDKIKDTTQRIYQELKSINDTDNLWFSTDHLKMHWLDRIWD